MTLKRVGTVKLGLDQLPQNHLCAPSLMPQLAAPSFHGHGVLSRPQQWMASTWNAVAAIWDRLWVSSPTLTVPRLPNPTQELTDREWSILTQVIDSLNHSESAQQMIRAAIERANKEQSAQKISYYMLNVSRSLYVTSSGRIHVKLTRKRWGDQPIGQGSSKVVYKAPELELGGSLSPTSGVDAYISVKRRRNDPSFAEANRQEFEHAREFLPIVRGCSFRAGVFKDSWLEQKLQGSLAAANHLKALDFHKGAVRREIAIQLASQVAALHQKGYFHRDIKPENVLYSVDQSGVLKLVLADLGFLIQKGADVKEVCGSLMYCSPEAVREAHSSPLRQHVKLTYATEAHDGWQLGATLLGLFFENLDPQFIADNPKLGEWISCGGNVEAQGFWNYTHWISSPLSQNEWIREPQDKDSIEYILWKLLLINPQERWTPAQALEGFLAHDF